MAFVQIDEASPTGRQKGKVLDETIRDFKTQVVTNLQQISGYPDTTALITLAWTTDGRPANPVVNLFGYNTTLGAWEYWNGTEWGAMGSAPGHHHQGSDIDSAVANATLAVTATTANNIPTADVGGNIWIA